MSTLCQAAPDPALPLDALPPRRAVERRVLLPPAATQNVSLSELWRYRRLVTLMVWRDFRVRFMQSYFSAAWVILQPLFNVVFCTFIFYTIAKIPSDGTPYYLFNYTAFIPWLIFNQALLAAASSLVTHSTLLQKVYFPRLLLPVYAVLAYLPDLLLMLALQVVIIAFWGYLPNWRWVVLPFFFAWLFTLALAVGVFLAGLNARYRDVGHGLIFALQLWFYITPIAYPTKTLPGVVRMIGYLNPLTWIVDGMRWAILRTDTRPQLFLLVPLALTLLLLVQASRLFRSSEATFADVI